MTWINLLKRELASMTRILCYLGLHRYSVFCIKRQCLYVGDKRTTSPITLHVCERCEKWKVREGA